MNYNNTFYKTFTGTDTIAFALFPSCKPILLGSLTTISYSIYREKKPVPLIGKINTGGFTRGMRSVAGTMIFTLVNQHFVRDILEQVPYLKQHGKLKADELPFFDIMLISSNEYGSATQMMIYGIEIIEEGQVVSIQDIFVENTFTFVARDLDEFTRFNALQGTNYTPRHMNINTVPSFTFSQADFERSLDEWRQDRVGSEDVIEAQNILLSEGKISTVSGTLDDSTLKAINDFQKKNDLTVTNYLDNTTYQLMKKLNEDGTELMSVNNKNGAYVYSDINRTNPIGVLSKGEAIVGKENTINGVVSFDFNGNLGYVDNKDVSEKDIVNYSFSDMAENNTILDTTYEDFNPSEVGTTFVSSMDTAIKATAVSHYGDVTKTFSREFDVDANKEFEAPISILSDSYIYDIDQKSKPSYIEYFVLPNEGQPKKFMINFI